MVTDNIVSDDDGLSAEPTESLQTQPKKSRMTIGISLLFAFTLSAGITGGTIGALATRHWMATDISMASALQAQPVSLAAYQSSNVAGLIHGEVGPAVVEVQVYTLTRRGQALSGSGSGVVVDPKGLILTNEHVISGARALTVRFSTGDTREAKFLSVDTSNDLAVLKVDLPPNVPTARLGNSDRVQVGEIAVAIGNPFGLEQTVTQGIISAVGREWKAGAGQPTRNLIQTDAPVNPGNSGGPLVNATGEVIGITNMIESPVKGSVGVGFAIPINAAKNLIAKQV